MVARIVEAYDAARQNDHGWPVVIANRAPPLTLSRAIRRRGRDRALLPRHKVAAGDSAALEETAELTVRIVDAAEGRALNRDYAGATTTPTC